jgi:hypothetical protein
VDRDGKIMAFGVVCPGRKTVDRIGVPTTPSGGIINAGIYARGDHANRMVPIFIALRAARRRLPFTDPFKRGIGASYVVPLYARRNDTVLSRDAGRFGISACSWLSDPSCSLALENRFEWRICCVTSRNIVCPSCMLISEFEPNR